MLTVKDRATDTLSGLESGADAYIPKDDFAETNLLQALRDLGIA
jgi:DNA-binding NarL/FixJ family response regulator